MSSKRDYGDGGIDGSGTNWRLRWRVNGRRYSKRLRGTKREAQTELRRLVKTVDDGAHVAPDKITVATWADRWLALLARRDGDEEPRRSRGLINARTWERYESMVRIHIVPALGAQRLQQLQPAEIDSFYIALEKTLAASTARFVHIVLGACLDAAVRKGLIASNPARKAEAPVAGDSDAGRVLDKEELGALLAGFRGRALYPIVAVASFTGMRRNELLALRWSDLDLPAKTLRIGRTLEVTKAHGTRFKEPKTERGWRTIMIDDSLVALLSAERERYLRIVAGIGDGDPAIDLSLVRLPNDALVFPAPAIHGQDFDITVPRAPSAITGRFADRAAELSFPGLRFHDLRGTHETMLLDAGVPVHVVAARCGHDPAVLLRSYAKRTKKADTSAAAVIGELSRSIIG